MLLFWCVGEKLDISAKIGMHSTGPSDIFLTCPGKIRVHLSVSFSDNVCGADDINCSLARHLRPEHSFHFVNQRPVHYLSVFVKII